MKLTALSFENYKAFSKRESIEVRPLTILIGRNNAGKSAISRLPLLIARALSDRAESPFEFKFNGMDFGASFLDLIHNRVPHGSVGIGATFTDDEGKTTQLWGSVQYFNEYKLQLVSRFFLRKMNDSAITLSWIGREPLKEGELYCVEETEQKCRVSFQGFFPQFIQPIEENQALTLSLEKGLMDIRLNNTLLAKATKNMTYLGYFRQQPQRLYNFPSRILHNVGFNGVNAPELLGDDFLRNKGIVLEAVSEWISHYLGGWKLDIDEQGEMFSLIMRNPDNPSVAVNLVDVGTGIAQVLPIIVQRQFEAITGQTGNLEIVEQPELHLHPDAHGNLADLYVEAIKQSDARFIIETHSEIFLLRIRRWIAEKKLEPNQVIIYWINDDPNSGERIQTIHIQKDGEVDKWPKGIFSEDFEEVRAIRKAQKDFWQ